MRLGKIIEVTFAAAIPAMFHAAALVLFANGPWTGMASTLILIGVSLPFIAFEVATLILFSLGD